MTSNSWTARDLPDLHGKTFVVTGATSGLGETTARDLAAAGAHVVLAVRNTQKGHEVAGTIAGSTEVRPLDLSSLASVRTFASEWDDDIEVLINNAGIMQVPAATTEDGFEIQFGTNHLGHFALTNLLLPKIRRRVVTLSSAFHQGGNIDFTDLAWQRRPYDSAQAYKDSKLANLLFARELNRQLTVLGSPVTSMAAHPGVVRTGLFSHVGGITGLGFAVGSRVIAQNVGRGVLPSLYAATQDIPGGSYVGPDGLRGLRGFPAVTTSSADADREDLAHQLWTVSETLTNTRIALVSDI